MEEETQLQEAETPETSDTEAVDEALTQADDQVDANVKKWEAEAKKYKAIAERKTKQLEKVTSSLKDEETPKAPKPDDGFISKKEFEETRFFDKHPEYDSLKDVILGLRQGDEPLEAVIGKDTFKNVFTAVTKAKEAEDAKSVLETNPRLGQVTDKLGEAKAAFEKGEIEEAKMKAVEAVFDAYPDLKQ